VYGFQYRRLPIPANEWKNIMGRALFDSILYVEDDPDIQIVVKTVLTLQGGFNVTACSSGCEALSIAAKFTPDLLLLDVMMPRMSGISTLAGLRKLPHTATTPAIFMTTKVQPDDLAHYRSVGALGAIAKPFDPLLLVQQLHKLWGKSAAE
jgi:two-component system OmpR family response regulator